MQNCWLCLKGSLSYSWNEFPVHVKTWQDEKIVPIFSFVSAFAYNCYCLRVGYFERYGITVEQEYIFFQSMSLQWKHFLKCVMWYNVTTTLK